MAKKSQSPLPPKKVRVQIQLSFYDALKELISGKKMTRLEWGDVTEYGFIEGTYLKIHKGGKIHNWIVSEGDIQATDWVIM